MVVEQQRISSEQSSGISIVLRRKVAARVCCSTGSAREQGGLRKGGARGASGVNGRQQSQQLREAGRVMGTK
eukprot:6204769-Pleurochrysis_carterae.AAC.3